MSESLNPLDDTSTVTAMLASENESAYLGKKITLILRCKSGRAEAYINWNNYLGSTAVVTDRIDKAQAERLGWTLSTDAQASFRPRSQGFMDALAEATTYIAQVTPYNESPVTASFSVVGARQVVDRIKVSCSW
jgi:type VI secretion system protein VasI